MSPCSLALVLIKDKKKEVNTDAVKNIDLGQPGYVIKLH